MVELIVVMVLIGILGAIGAARFFDRKSFDTTAFADQVLAAVRYAQKVAIARNGTFIDGTLNNARIYVRLDGASIALCHDTASPCTPVQAPFTVKTDGTYCKSASSYCLLAPTGVSYSTSVTGSPAFIGFDALGRPVDVNGVALAAQATITIAGGSSRKIVIEPETGYVH
jgi:MSHA pilin protein MshC